MSSTNTTTDIVLNFIYFLSWLLHEGFLLLQQAGSYSLVAICRPLIAMASLVAQHGLWDTQASVVVISLAALQACGISPDQVSNPCPMHWQVDS